MMKQAAAIPHRPMQPSHSQFRRLPWLVCLSIALPIAGLAQTNVPAPLPPAAQEAFDKGIMAAREQGYIVAIRYLQDARKLAPQAPQIFRSLGAVEAKIPGRELRSIAWYGAYLAAIPNAPDAAEVKKEISRLEIKSQVNISGLIKSVQDAASQLSDDNHNQSSDLFVVAKLWLGSGDIAVAQKTTDLIQASSWKSYALSFIAEAKFKAGDLAGAKTTWASALKTADLIDTEPSFGLTSPAGVKMNTQEAIAIAQALSGDIAGALKTADHIKEISHKCRAQRTIAEGQINAGDIAGAQKTLATAQKTADLIQDADLKSYVQTAIAEAKAKASNTNAPSSTRQSPSDTQPPIQPVITVSDWLKKLDDANKSNDCPLNTEPFLDLAGYLKSLPPSDDAEKVFYSLRDTAKTIVSAQNVITGMLKQQARK